MRSRHCRPAISRVKKFKFTPRPSYKWGKKMKIKKTLENLKFVKGGRNNGARLTVSVKSRNLVLLSVAVSSFFFFLNGVRFR